MMYQNPFMWCVIQRILSVFFIQTSYAPDEYWQSLEVAHKLAFGYGYFTWEWTSGIRSYLYPVIIAGLYKTMHFFNVDSVYWIVLIPRLAQALASAMADYYFVKWYQETTGRRPAWAWFSILTSWFWVYCASRTLANTMETVLTVFGLYFYPWSGVMRACEKKPLFLWFVGLACIIRPTAALVWLPMCLFHVFRSPNVWLIIFWQYLPISVLLLTFSTLLDSICHGQLVFTWWNFLHANIFQGVSDFYGTNTTSWYLCCGLPVVMGLHIVPFILGCYRLRNTTHRFSIEFIITLTILWTLIILSSISHKEFRFLLPLLPMCLHISTSWLSTWSRQASNKLLVAVALMISFACIVPNAYVGYYHQRGVLDVMPILAQIAQAQTNNASFLFLMPCHSTPLYSHLHVNVATRFLTCLPDFAGNPYYTDEADVFYQQPVQWLLQQYPSNGSDLPSHIICFDSLIPQIIQFINAKRYFLHSKLFHTYHPTERVGQFVLIYERY